MSKGPGTAAIALAGLALLAGGCDGRSRAARLYAREAQQATREALRLDSWRAPKAIGDCLATDASRRLNLIDLERPVRDVAAGTTYDRVLLNQVSHVVVRIRAVPLGSVVTVHVRPQSGLAPRVRSRVTLCAGR